MEWWIWLVFAIVLFAGEVIVSLDFFLFFVGLGFFLTGILVSTGLLPETWMQVIACSILIIAFLFYLKPKLNKKIATKGRKEDLVGDTVEIINEIPSNSTGTGNLRGSSWQVKNNTNKTLAANSKHIVSKIDGISLIIE